MQNPSTRPASDTRRKVAWAITWGLATSFIEPVSYLVGNVWTFHGAFLWWVFQWQFPTWCLFGYGFVWVAARYDYPAPRALLVLGWLVMAAIAAIVQPLLSLAALEIAGDWLSEAATFSKSIGHLISPNNLISTLVYNLWISLFYGGVLVVGYVLNARAERTRLMLHTSAVARSSAEAMLVGAQLEILEGQIDPELLLNSMRELEHLYKDRPERADSLMNALVEFLRTAMAGLRDPVSTLETEIGLAKAFVDLQCQRGVPGRWHIGEPAESARRMPFPSLSILPLLNLAGNGANPSIEVQSRQGAVTLCVSGFEHEASTTFCDRLRVRLRALYGERCFIDARPETGTQLVIGLGASGSTGDER